MAEYHVKTDKEGNILAGTMKADNTWNRKSIVTDEVLAATRDHLFAISVKEKRDMAYAWQYDNGKTVILKLDVKNTDEIQEENEEDN